MIVTSRAPAETLTTWSVESSLEVTFTWSEAGTTLVTSASAWARVSSASLSVSSSSYSLISEDVQFPNSNGSTGLVSSSFPVGSSTAS